jgi:hypothetical protein
MLMTNSLSGSPQPLSDPEFFSASVEIETPHEVNGKTAILESAE